MEEGATGTSTKSVRLIGSWATLLSGSLFDCRSIDDTTCKGGFAALAAYERHYAEQGPALVVVKADQQSLCIQMVCARCESYLILTLA